MRPKGAFREKLGAFGRRDLDAVEIRRHPQPQGDVKRRRRCPRTNRQEVLLQTFAHAFERIGILAHHLARVAPEFDAITARPRDGHGAVPADARDVVGDEQPAAPAERRRQRGLADRRWAGDCYAFPVRRHQRRGVERQFATLVNQCATRAAEQKESSRAAIRARRHGDVDSFSVADEIARDRRNLEQLGVGCSLRTRSDVCAALQMVRKRLHFADHCPRNSGHWPCEFLRRRKIPLHGNRAIPFEDQSDNCSRPVWGSARIALGVVPETRHHRPMVLDQCGAQILIECTMPRARPPGAKEIGRSVRPLDKSEIPFLVAHSVEG